MSYTQIIYATLNILHERPTGWHFIKPKELCTDEIFWKRRESKEMTKLRMGVIMDILKTYKFDIVVLQETGRTLKRYLINLRKSYYVVNGLNDDEQVMLIKKSKFKNVKIEYKELKRVASCTCVLNSGTEILLVNGHLTWAEDDNIKKKKDKKKEISYITKKIKNVNTYIIGGDMNTPNKNYLFTDANSLVYDIDSNIYKTSYSRGECDENGFYRMKNEDDRYEFVDHIYTSKNIKAGKVHIYNHFSKNNKLKSDVLFRTIKPPYMDTNRYNENDWPTDHALLVVKLQIPKK